MTAKKQRDDKDILASTIKLSKSHGVNLRGLKGFLISTKFRGSSSHFHVDHVIIVDFYLALTSHVFYPINLKLVFWGLQTTNQVPSKAQSPTPKFFFWSRVFLIFRIHTLAASNDTLVPEVSLQPDDNSLTCFEQNI